MKGGEPLQRALIYLFRKAEVRTEFLTEIKRLLLHCCTMS
jgi:hypothetical protein